MTPEERAVIDAAIERWSSWIADETESEDLDLAGAVQALIFTCPRCNAGGHTCPGCGAGIGHTATAYAQCEREALPYDAPVDTELKWWPRTYADVRTGDTIRASADAPVARVLTCSQGHWHVRASGKTGPWAHMDDVPVEHDITAVRLDYAGGDPERLLHIPSTAPVEIQLTEAEFLAIETLGWDRIPF